MCDCVFSSANTENTRVSNRRATRSWRGNFSLFSASLYKSSPLLPPSSPCLPSLLLSFSPYAIEGLHIGHPGFLYEPFTIQLHAFFFSPFDMQRNLLILFAALMVRLHQRLGCSEGCLLSRPRLILPLST